MLGHSMVKVLVHGHSPWTKNNLLHKLKQHAVRMLGQAKNDGSGA